LGDGRQFVRADFHSRRIHSFLLFRLPELIHPAEAIAGGEHFHGQAGEQGGEPVAKLCWQPHLQHRIIRPENARQHPLRERGRDFPFVALGFLGAFRAELQIHVQARFRLDQESVFRQKPREQHPMPMHIRAFVNQALHLLRIIRSAHVADLPAMCPQFLTQILASLVQVRRFPRLPHAVGLQRRRRPALRFLPRLQHRAFQLPPKFFGQCAHKLFVHRFPSEHPVGVQEISPG